jgi:hypothetical protein
LLHRVPRLRGATVHVDPHDHRQPSGPMAHHRGDHADAHDADQPT